MDVLHVFILGIIEGVTEFLPVSSTAHLLIANLFLGIEQTEFTSLFDVVIQTGAILAVAFWYTKTVIQHPSYIKHVLIAFVPTAIIGLVMHDVIKGVFFESMIMIALALIVVGALFIYLEKWISKNHIPLGGTIQNMTIQHALIIGTIQAAAIVPGVSRAGAVIVAMLFLRYKRTEAALFSFLLAVPTIAGAGVVDLMKTDARIFTSQNILLIMIGSVVSLLSALIFVKWLISYLQSHSLEIFGWYRIILGAIVLIAISIGIV